jgi:hypothetical protein
MMSGLVLRAREFLSKLIEKKERAKLGLFPWPFGFG